MAQDKTMLAQMPEVSVSEALHAIRHVIDHGCRLLDAETYFEWLATCADDLKYSIRAYSPEIRNEVTWLEKDHKGLELLFKQLPMHEKYKGQFRRVPGWTDIVSQEGSTGTFIVESSLCVYHTDIHGMSILYCTGKYQDKFRFESGVPVMCSRLVMMDTRRLPFGSHIPI
jgi:3-phenylpropionate/cinnamic acid dioxygenase small subunit